MSFGAWLALALLAWALVCVPAALFLARFIDRGQNGPPDT